MIIRVPARIKLFFCSDSASDETLLLFQQSGDCLSGLDGHGLQNIFITQLHDCLSDILLIKHSVDVLTLNENADFGPVLRN